MQPKLLLALLAGVLATGAAFAQSTPAPAPAPDRAAKMQHHFTAMDKNGDGAISRDEAAAHKGLVKHFDEIDANKDGKLTKEEMQGFHKTMRDKHAAKFDEKFKAADKDNDGALTKAEAEAGKMRHVVKHFDQLDANKDGKVTRDELRAGMEKRKK